MRIFGLTGNIGTGKSSVLGYLSHKGALVLDADKVAHAVMQRGTPTHAAVKARFGQAILHDDGQINRPALGRIVFGDATALTELEQIVHPAVRQQIREALDEAAASGTRVALIEAIKLLESKALRALCDEIWVVYTDKAEQMRRLVEQRGLSEVDARQRIAAQEAQSPQAWKMNQADRVIDNSGSLADLHHALDQIWDEAVSR